MDRRLFIAAIAAGIMVPAGAHAAAPIQWVVPFEQGGGTDVWARFMAGWLSATLPGRPEVRRLNISGGNSTRAANFFAAEARADGRMLLGTTGSTQFAALLGDRRVQYDYADWRIVAASPSGGVIYVPASLGIGSMAELIARGQKVHFGSIGAASLDIVPLLALEILGLEVAVLLGLNSRNAARAGLIAGEFDVDYQTSPGYLAQVRPLVEAGQVVPLMSLGALDRNGRLDRDPAFPALPSFLEVYRQIHGRDPEGAAWQAWQALFRAGFAAQKMVFLPRSVPEARTDVFRRAFARIAADRRFRAEASAVLGPYPLLAGPQADAALASAMTMVPEIRNWTRDWLERRFRVTP
ncbi:tripartite-type tricarboxylate transporter receptor subunit TctC [Rhizobium subbaraonis]|uniref:Tripartite-type tricarboxylate transporter receptor subunit TctC n=1 Tax=Rhizobium subbaraonis TaxID=908946 RepID=A0A285UTQ2_9HYPH|nr:tripartite-type tricarboxylate transporter receptor subunit TctC [Rhizobium subbaraonis]